MSILKKIAYTLVIIGALNWGLYGAFGGYDLIESLFGTFPMISGILYVLVGLSGLYLLLNFISSRKSCSCSAHTCECSIPVNTGEKQKTE